MYSIGKLQLLVALFWLQRGDDWAIQVLCVTFEVLWSQCLGGSIDRGGAVGIM